MTARPDPRIVLVRGDITDQDTAAIVNAANSTLLGGGGVDGSIHRRGGPEILKACREIRTRRYPRGLPTGLAVSTTAGRLAARRVIHAVGPVWRGGEQGEQERLRSAYRSSLDIAGEEGLRTIAFPSISTGAYGYPIEQAAHTALDAVDGWLSENTGSVDEVRFVLFSQDDHAVYARTLESLRNETE